MAAKMVKTAMKESYAAMPQRDPPDRRLNAYRPDLADSRLRSKVKARRFTAGILGRIAAPAANLYREPPNKEQRQNNLLHRCETEKHGKTAKEKKIAEIRQAGAETQLLYGAEVRIFERRSGYAWVQALADSYVGYIQEKALLDSSAETLGKPTHRLAVPRSFLYSEADLRSAPTQALSMGSVLTIIGIKETRGTHYGLLSSGEAIIAKHLQKLKCFAEDYVSVAETLLHTPYLWGGSSAFGIDCSALVQLSMAMTGRQVLRDSDMQAATIGRKLLITEGKDKLQRGDLLFWQGHVAIATDKNHIIHANGATMSVSKENLEKAKKRIAPLYGQPTLYRRP